MGKYNLLGSLLSDHHHLITPVTLAGVGRRYRGQSLDTLNYHRRLAEAKALSGDLPEHRLVQWLTVNGNTPQTQSSNQ